MVVFRVAVSTAFFRTVWNAFVAPQDRPTPSAVGAMPRRPRSPSIAFEGRPPFGCEPAQRDNVELPEEGPPSASAALSEGLSLS